jgi:hypothetical protein
MGFAIALLQVTLAASIEEFFLRLLVPIVAALVWAGIERAIWKHPLGQRFWEINCCYALIILLICFLDHYDLHVIRDPLWHWQASVVFVVAASLTAALFDVHAQMVHVASGGPK